MRILAFIARRFSWNASCLLGGLLAFPPTVNRVAAATYQFKGEITLLSSLASSNNPPKERRKLFDVSICESNWWIRAELTNPPTELPADSSGLKGFKMSNPSATIYVGDEGSRQTVEYELEDGTLFFKQIFFISDKDREQLPKRTPHSLGIASEHLDIFGGGIPRFDNDLCFPIWLAFCSHGYLPEGESPAPPMIWIGTPAQQEDIYTLICTSERPKRNTYCPFYNDITFRNNGYFPRYSTNSIYSVIKALQGDLSFVEAHFYVSNWSSVDGIEYPRTSYFDFFSAPPTKLIKEFIISVDSFTNSSQPIPGIKPTGLAIVADHRLESKIGSGTVAYVTTNALLDPSSPIARKVAYVDSRGTNLARNSTDTNRSGLRAVILVAMALVALFPLILWMINYRTNKTKKE